MRPIEGKLVEQTYAGSTCQNRHKSWGAMTNGQKSRLARVARVGAMNTSVANDLSTTGLSGGSNGWHAMVTCEPVQITKDHGVAVQVQELLKR